MGNPVPTQTRSIDAYASYNSDIANRLTRIISSGEDCILIIDPIEVEIINSTTIRVTSGKCIKDDVLIETGELSIDMTDSDFYVSGSAWDETGYYYVVLEYEYQQTNPPPTVSIQIIKDSERSTLYDLDTHLFLACIEISGSYQVDKIYSYDPDDATIRRETCGATSGISGGTSIFDEYEDLLLTSIYKHATYDDFPDTDLVDTPNTTMTYDVSNNEFDYTNNQILQSVDLINTTAVTGFTTVYECMVSIDYDYDGTSVPLVQVSTTGSAWENTINNQVHTFSTPGTELYIKFTGVGGTGIVRNWGIFYGNDPTALTAQASRRKFLTFHYGGVCIDEDVIIDGLYFDNTVQIDKLTIHARVAPDGTSDVTIDLLIDGVEQSTIATLSAGSTYERTTFTSQIRATITDRFGLKIKTVGSTEPGQGITAIVHYYDI